MFLNDSNLRNSPEWVSKLLNWYDAHKRDFPWRREVSVYHTWICEVMSQQTTMAVVVPRFESFVRELPTLADLAHCPDETLRELWSGLGYYARARNLRNGAHHILTACQGQFPSDYQSWLQVPGVGPYTASVIASICFREPKACVDGNVIRVVSRLTGCVDTAVWSEVGKKQIQSFADHFIDAARPGDFNQAMMELGATVCQKKSPDCDRCPLVSHCRAFDTRTVQHCPPNKPRKAFETVDLESLRIFGCDSPGNNPSDVVLLVERQRGFLSKTVGFPLLKEPDRVRFHDWLAANELVASVNTSDSTVAHTITHHQIQVRTVDVELKPGVGCCRSFLQQFSEYFSDDFSDGRWVSKSQTTKSLASSLDRKIWENISLF